MVSRSTIRKRKRSADPEYRKKKREHFRVFWAVHKDEINARKRARPRGDFRRRYGMSWNDYDELLARQGGVCAICKKKSKRRLCVDHCHACRKVRGLLCFKCNTGLGLFDDDTDRLRAAIAYLENSRREGSCDAASIDHRDDDNPSPNKGAHMTQMKDASHSGTEPLSAVDLGFADSPPIAVDQGGGDATGARPLEQLGDAEFAPLDLAELLTLDIPERGMVLDPIIP